MGQVTIYLDDETERKMVVNAEAMNLSKSKWIAQVIQESLVDEWPKSVRNLPGSWDAFPSLEAIRETADHDVDREPM